VGQFDVEAVPSGGFTTASFAGTFYMGDLEVVSFGVASAEQVGVAVTTATAGGGYTITSDYTATYGQDADKTETGATGTITVNSNGTFSISDHPGVITGIIISSTKAVGINIPGYTYTTIQVIKQ
jgi:hypothetical protein